VVAATCGDLMEWAHQRNFAIKAQQKLDRAMEGEIRKRLGFRTVVESGDAAPEEERERLSAAARAIKAAIEADRPAPKGRENVTAAVRAMVLRNLQSRRPWDEFRAEAEKRMQELAADLPAADFVAGVRGLTLLGFAVIVGEAGDLSGYPDDPRKHGDACLWKRLGLAVIDGRRQGSPAPGATAADWVRHGYARTRRAQVWAFVDDVLFRSQWRGARDECGKAPKKGAEAAVAAHAIGPYGEKYGAAKARYVALNESGAYADRAAEIIAQARKAGRRPAKSSLEWLEAGKLAPKHIEQRARRAMAKKLVRDLWKAWTQAMADAPPGHGRSSRLADAAD
jgi:hypothetical protein